jgi:hypothetical protein
MASSQTAENVNKQAGSSDAGEIFLQFRRKVQQSELLSAATARLLESLSYTGRLTVLLQNGRILKSGYEEGYFRRKDDLNF